MKHLLIPDVQVRPGDSFDFLRHIGLYIVEKQPDVIVNIGDFADMPSLSTYDYGKKAFEGRRYTEDVQATHEAMATLLAPLEEYNARQRKNGKKQYKPRMVLTLGNHENRINKAVNDDAKLEGLLSTSDLLYEDFGWEVFPFLEVAVVDGVAYCFDLKELVLRSDFTYQKVGELKVGDKLLGFDEHGNTKKYREAVVEGVEFDNAPTYDVTDSSGLVTRVTGDHLWLVRPYGSQYKWVSTNDLKPGYEILKPFDIWKQSEELDMAWMGGFLDGEGWLSKPTPKQGGIQVGFAQNPGVVLDKALGILDKYEYTYTVDTHTKCSKVRLLGSLNDKIRFLVEAGSVRLLSKLSPSMLGRLQTAGKNAEVVSVVGAGIQQIVKVKTSTGTLIVNGAAHHNCHYFTTGSMGRPAATAQTQLSKKHMSCVAGHQQGFQIATGHRADGKRLTSIIAGSCYEHNEDYMGPQGNKHWRGIVMLNDVEDGEFEPMQLSLKYLRKRYG